MFVLPILLISLLPLSSPATPLLFLGTTRYLLSLPSFYPSTTLLPPHPVGSGLNGAVAGLANEHLLVCGGYNGQWTNLRSCHALIEGEWIEMESLSIERCHAAASFTSSGAWMVTGGQDDRLDALASTEVLGAAGIWEPGPDMLGGKRMEHCQVTTALGILIIGGFNYEDRVVDSVIMLAPNSSTWIPITNMKHRRQTFACVLKDDEVWVMGGFHSTTEGGPGFLSSTEVFSISTKTWRDGPELPFSVNWGQAVVYDDDLYHIGGIHSEGRVLRLAGEVWEEVASTAYDDVRDIFQAVVIEDGCQDCTL